MQLNYDYFTTTNNCKKFTSRVQTNPRYKNFTQLYYTVGDVEQFWMAVNEEKLHLHLNSGQRTPTHGGDCATKDGLTQDNLFKNIETFLPFDGYKNISEAQIEDTFNYMFHKFKKGIFIQIKDGQLASFVPFSKAAFRNEWAHLIKVDPVYGSMENFFRVHHNLANKLNRTQYKFNRNKINFDPSFWYANNCILRYENPINEGETNYAQIKSMFLELCAERELPDMVFFVNRRDFPLLTRNGTEPYNNIYGDDVPLQSYKFDKYIPILSMCSSDRFADIAIPTHEDWSRIKSNEGVFFPQKCRNYTFKFNLKWKTKKNIAVFRGSNTGCGYNSDNNTRLKLAKLGMKYPQFLDVGITNWNLRIRKNKGSEYLHIPLISSDKPRIPRASGQRPDSVGEDIWANGGIELVTKLSPEEQSDYKYLINVDGHVSAFRLSLELSMGCCILMVESVDKWKMWFSDMLEPYVHYVPIKADLSDLIDQIQWCRKNDDECKKISENAVRFHNKYLTKKGILDNLQKTLFELHYQMYGSSPKSAVVDPLLFQSAMEHKALLSDNKKISTYMLTGLFPRNIGRNYGTLKALQLFITQSVKPEDSITLVGVEVQTLFRSKTTKVVLYQIGAKYIIAKQTRNSIKKVEFIHEAFIGKYVINSMLRSCPNFVFTINYRDEPYLTDVHSEVKETTVLQEYVQGPTLQEFLKDCTFKAYLEIVLSLSCALFTAQIQCGFVHHDLKPWNVMVNILSEPIVVDYYIKNDKGVDLNYKLKTKYIPVIVDFGKSHVIFNNIHYGIIDPFTMNKYIDLISLIISSINELMFRSNNSVDIGDVIYIANFFSSGKINGSHELESFLNKTKKFANLNMSDIKAFREEENIFELFFKYVGSLIRKYKISFGKDTLTANVWSSNAKQIADMGFALEPSSKINSYLDVVRTMYKTPLPQATNRFTTIMIAQKMFEGLTIPKMEFLEFATRENLDKTEVENVLKEFNKMENFITDFYSKQLNKKVREPFNLIRGQDEPPLTTEGRRDDPKGEGHREHLKNVMNFNLKPTRSLFLSSDETKLKTVQQINSLPKYFPRLHYYRSLILDVLRNRGPFKLNEYDKKFYMDNFQIIFDEKYASKVEDIETIRFYLKNSND